MELFHLDKDIRIVGHTYDDIFLQVPQTGKNSWTYREYKYAVENDTNLENGCNPIDSILALDKWSIERNGMNLWDETVKMNPDFLDFVDKYEEETHNEEVAARERTEYEREMLEIMEKGDE
jgi:hypothetical protein